MPLNAKEKKTRNIYIKLCRIDRKKMQKRLPNTKKDLSIHKEGAKMLDYFIMPLIMFFIVGMIIIITYDIGKKVIEK